MLPTQSNIAAGEGQWPEVTINMDSQGNLPQYLDIIIMIKLGTLTGQMHMLIEISHIMKKGLLISLETGIIHIHHQNTNISITKLPITAIIIIMFNIIHQNCLFLNTSELIGSLQSQIIGLQLQPLQQATLNSINTFDGTKKAEFATWAQSIENAMRICNLDAIDIALSKLQGAKLKLAIYLKGKETSTNKKLFWITLKSPHCQLLWNPIWCTCYKCLQHTAVRCRWINRSLSA